VFCFNTLEHFENPIKSLKELKRHARKSILIIIPYVEKTNIYPPLEKDEISGRNRWHFFEFCHEDLLRILEFNDLKSIKWEILKPPFKINNLKTLIFYLRYNKLVLFYGRSFYELKILDKWK
jgi:hypothetical protein|tara:strand:+ start:183 stop:548 length:366 start_codon:yes stop_codon:yes gene_type:complete